MRGALLPLLRVIVQHSKIVGAVTEKGVGPSWMVNVMNRTSNKHRYNVTLFNAILQWKKRVQ